MAERQEPRVRLSVPDHIGIVVKDLDQAIGYYGSLFGWGPFQVQEVDMKGLTFRGQPGSGRFKVAYARSGSIVIEVFQGLEGEKKVNTVGMGDAIIANL